MENIVLKLHYKVHFVEILVEDTDRTLLIDVYNEMFDEVETENIEWPLNPSLTYSYNSRSVLVREDCDLMEMFNRLGSKKTIDIWIGADDEPCHVLVMARQVRSYNAKKNVEVVEVSVEQNKQWKRREKIPFRTSVSKPPPTSPLIPVVEADVLVTIEDVELCIEPSKTALISPRRSSRLNKSQVTEPSQPTSPDQATEPGTLCDQDTEPDMNVVASSSVIMSPRRSIRLNKNQLSQSIQPSEPDMNVGASSADVLRNYCVQEGFKLVVIKAEYNRYTATCATLSCGWRIHASMLPDGRTWAIESLKNPDHGCDGVRNNNPMANCRWVAQKLMEDIRANHAITATTCNDLLMKRYGLTMPKSTIYKMKDIALNEINGGHDDSYRLLTQYYEMIKVTNPGSVALASGSVNQEGHLQFKSCFIAFHAQFVGFMRSCRSLIGVDGAHLKGNYGGVPLSAVGLDGNNEIYPIALAIVDSENKESLSYFFRQLKQILNESGRDNWTIISDRQKGVEPALEAVWPESYRRFCCRHLCKNFKQDHPGLLMHGLFWKVVNATSEFSFKKALESVAEHGGLCGGWQISGIPCKHAVRAILDADREPSDYVSEWFSVKRYKEAYGQNIHPIPDSTHWQRFNVPTLEPPQLKRSIGRPARNRRREPGEQRKGKRSIVITCKKCGCMGHNSKTCKGGYTAKEKGQLQGKVIQKRTKTKSQPTSSRINTTSLHDLEAMIKGSQTSASIIPTPNSQGQSSTQTQPSTSEGPQKRGRKRKSSSTSK